MKQEIKVPAMGESISEAIVGQILKPTGSFVRVDDEILELETDKVNQVLYAQVSGMITFTVSLQDVVKIGQVLGYIDTEAKDTGQKVDEQGKKEERKQDILQTEKATTKDIQEEKKIIKEEIPKEVSLQKDLSLRKTKESFLDELKTKPSQEEALSKPSTSKLETQPQRETRRKMPNIRKMIAQRLVEVKQTTAMLTTFNEVDMTPILVLREKYKDLFMKQYKVKLGLMSFFVKATVFALQAVPGINSYIEGDDIVHREYYDIGVAVSTDRGLIVPVVRNCDKLSFAEIELTIENFAKKAREGTLVVDDLKGGGFTITNGGIFGSLLSTPILNPPQSGILGMHKIMKRPVVVDDQIVIKSMMYLALSYDHRIIDGKEAVTFLVHIKNYLEDPTRLLIGI